MALLMGLHIIFLIIWSAGLFYVPILCARDYRDGRAMTARHLRILTRFLFVGVASPAAVLTIVTGAILVYQTGASGSWLAAKLTVVAMMAAFHGLCGHLINRLGHEGHQQQRIRSASGWMVAVPALLVPVVLWLVLSKPALMS